MKFRDLSIAEENICHMVMGSYAFFHIVMDHLRSNDYLSVIRVSDGEKAALEYCEKRVRDGHRDECDLLGCCDVGFRKRFGVEGITCQEINRRINWAAEECCYFAPSLGFYNEPYHVTKFFNFDAKRNLVCEMFQYHWDKKRRFALMREAKRVIIINRDPMIQKRLSLELPEVDFIHLPLDNWRESEAVLKEAVMLKPRLTLMSAALGSKYIGPRLACLTQSVVLDIGQAADVWHS